MNEQQAQQLIDMFQQGIQKAAETLGVAVPELWEIIVRQQYVEAVSGLIWGLLAVVVMGVYVTVVRKKWDVLVENDDADPAIFGGIFLVSILGFAAFMCLDTAIMHFLNPEYYAIKEIVEIVKGQGL